MAQVGRAQVGGGGGRLPAVLLLFLSRRGKNKRVAKRQWIHAGVCGLVLVVVSKHKRHERRKQLTLSASRSDRRRVEFKT